MRCDKYTEKNKNRVEGKHNFVEEKIQRNKNRILDIEKYQKLQKKILAIELNK